VHSTSTFETPPAEEIGRASGEELARALTALNTHPTVTALLEAVAAPVLILNGQRQIISANREARELVGHVGAGELLGRRPGEALLCAHVVENRADCGTGELCRSCGAARAIRGALATGDRVEREYLLTSWHSGDAEAVEFLARAAPLEVDGQRLVVLTLDDISHEKRRRALEQTFFHDLLNTAGGLRGWTEILQIREGPAADPALVRLGALARRLVDEVQGQRDLVQAESGELEPHRERVTVGELLEELRVLFTEHAVAEERTLELDDAARDTALITNPPLLVRVLTNMVKNAFEAIPPGARVRVWAETAPDTITFRVHNPGAMPRSVQLRVFQRSFTTKERPGRGLGAYGMKLFGERYLGGEVGFTSTAEAGTTFWLCVPRGQSA